MLIKTVAHGYGTSEVLYVGFVSLVSQLIVAYIPQRQTNCKIALAGYSLRVYTDSGSRA